MLYAALVDEDGDFNSDYCGFKMNVFYIDRFYVEESYRNQGIGEKTLDYLDDILNYSLNCEVGCYTLVPNPIEKFSENEFRVIENNDLNRKFKKKLLRFYSKCGFNRIPNTEFLYINTDYKKVKRDFRIL